VKEALWACFDCSRRGGFFYRLNNHIGIFLEKQHRDASPACRAKIQLVVDVESLTQEDLVPIQELERIGAT
jgi:hypothetical protein